MTTLKTRLDRILERYVASAPVDAQEVMGGAIEDLLASGLLSHLPVPGDPLPAFELPDSRGQALSSADLLAQGPLVITFFRGVW